MSIDQRALIIRVGPNHTDGLSELNVELQRGWRVVNVAPMGGTGLDESGEASSPFLAALVIIERSPREEEALPAAAQALKKIRDVEEEPKEIVEQVVEENGAGVGQHHSASTD